MFIWWNYILNLNIQQSFAAEKHENGFNYNTFSLSRILFEICILNFSDEQSESWEYEMRYKGLYTFESNEVYLFNKAKSGCRDVGCWDMALLGMKNFDGSKPSEFWLDANKHF